MSKQPTISKLVFNSSPLVGVVLNCAALVQGIGALLRTVSILSTNLLVVIVILLSIVLIILGPGVWL